MFDIKIGTIIPARFASAMIPKLNPYGFETYELDFKEEVNTCDMKELSKRIADGLDGRKISALGLYGNTICDEKVRAGVARLIENAHLFGCDRIGIFAGGDPTKSVPENIPAFTEIFRPLVKLAEDCGVKIGLENCGEGWDKGSTNIGFCPEAWELIFDAVPSDSLGLEWEPCHALMALCDPIAQLRKWAKKVVHVHGKDATIAWDIIREYGIRGIHQFGWNRTPGFGDTNWADIVTVLIQSGFEGSIDIEGYHDPVHYDDMEWTSQVTALNYLKRCRGGIDFIEGPEEYRGYQGKRH